MSLKRHNNYGFGDFRMDVLERLLRRGESVVPIAPKAFDALLLLTENAGALVDRTVLRERLWPGQIVEDCTIARVIADVRKALGDLGEERRYIETVPKFGYRFVASVQAGSRVSGSQPEGPPEIPQRPSLRWNWKLVATVLGATAVIAGAGFTLNRTPKVESLLITPFQVIGQSPDIGMLQLGLQDSLAMELSSLSSFSVIKVGETPDDAAELGRRHHAGFVLTGTVEPLSGRIHISARLLRSADGRAVWTHSFDETMDGIFKVQSRLAALTVAELIPSLPPAERSLMERRQPANGAAYRYYLLGRFYWNKRDQGGYRQALEMFQKALQADPKYAPAYLGLADSLLLATRPDRNLMEETLPSARAAIEKAVELDPALGEAHASLGLIAGSYDFDWNREERELQTAIRLVPQYVTAHHWYAEFLTMMGKFEHSAAEFEVTRNLDPTSPIVLTDFAQLQNFERKFQQSLVTLDEVLKLDPSFSLAHERKGCALMMLRRPREAMIEFELADQGEHRETSPLIRAWAAAVAGNRADALRFIGQAEEKDVDAILLSVIWGELGEADLGAMWLERAYERRTSGLVSVKVNPIFDPLRKSERFRSLLRRMNFNETTSGGRNGNSA